MEMTEKELIVKLKEKRSELARQLNIEAFKILHNSTIEEIAKSRPGNLEELKMVRGIGPKKLKQFGKIILEVINNGSNQETTVDDARREDKIYSVSEFLDYLNVKLTKERARIKGEISDLEEREWSVYFSLKDSGNESIINCYISRQNYEMMGVVLTEGLEIIVSGYPEIYKPSGRLSLQIQIIELVGEGVLKKAYEELKKKLAQEGLFAPERKKPIPDFASKIGLITSGYGDAIHDFESNLDKFGFEVNFLDCRVEGQQAVPDLVKAINWFNKNMPDLDVLVLVRGGGSWESLQAFNNEAVTRTITDSTIPILCGVGHEKDIPIACLVADLSVSTPTATAVILNKSWKEAIQILADNQRFLLDNFESMLEERNESLNSIKEKLIDLFDNFVLSRFDETINRFRDNFSLLGARIKEMKRTVLGYSRSIAIYFQELLKNAKKKLTNLEKHLEISDPRRQLKLGYSIVFKNEEVIKDVGTLKVGELINIKFHRGSADSMIKRLIKK